MQQYIRRYEHVGIGTLVPYAGMPEHTVKNRLRRYKRACESLGLSIPY